MPLSNGRLTVAMGAMTVAGMLVSVTATYFIRERALEARIAEIRETYMTKGEYRAQWETLTIMQRQIHHLEAENAVQAEQIRQLQQRVR